MKKMLLLAIMFCMQFKIDAQITSLTPRTKSGHQFVVYGDYASRTFPDSNAIKTNNNILSMEPEPEVILFSGDEVFLDYGAGAERLNEQWDEWLENNSEILNCGIPWYHAVGNHAIFNELTRKIWLERFTDIPMNGPDHDKGISYFIEKDDMLLIFVNTTYYDGIEGYVAPLIPWMDSVLTAHTQANYKFVIGHMPVFPVDGYHSIDTMRNFSWCVKPSQRKPFWDILVKHQVDAYLCSHIISYDIQAHDGILQIQSGGAAFPLSFPPKGEEYHHFVQLAVDELGLRLQTINMKGAVQDTFSWPLILTDNYSPLENEVYLGEIEKGVVFKFDMNFVTEPENQPLMESNDSDTLNKMKVAIRNNRIVVELPPNEVWNDQGKKRYKNANYNHGSERVWMSEPLGNISNKSIELLILKNAGPGGIMYRIKDETEWTSLQTNYIFGIKQLPLKWRRSEGFVNSCYYSVINFN